MLKMMMRCLLRVWSARMSLAVLFSSLFCFVAIGHYCWVTFAVPCLVCEEVEYKCGKVASKGTVEHDFVIGNSGWGVMHVKVKAGCGSCSTVKLSNNEIWPGNTAILNVVLHLDKLKKGAFKKPVLVKTDDPQSPKEVLFISGTAQ